MGVMLELDDYKADTREKDVQFFDKVAKRLKGMEENTNTYVAIPQTFNLSTLYQDSTGISTNWMVADSSGSKFYTVQSGFQAQFAHILLAPSTYKVVANEIFLSLNTTSIFNGDGGFFPPVASSSYSINYYISFRDLAQENGVTQINNFYGNLSGFCYPINISYNITTNKWAISEPLKVIKLSDTMPFRGVISGQNDFRNTDASNSNNKITEDDYQSLLTKKQILYFASGFASDERSALSAANRDHLDSYFTSTTASGFAIRVSVTFTYFGSLASFSI